MLFGDALGCDERLPLAFSAEPVAPDVASIQALGLLRALALFDEVRDGERDESDPQRAELARIEAKVDLVLGLLGGLLRERQPELPTTAVRWSRIGARFVTERVPTTATGHLQVLPDARMPQALLLPAKVIATRAEASGTTAWVRFELLDPAVEAALERHVFSRHRRQVALARRAAAGASAAR